MISVIEIKVDLQITERDIDLNLPIIGEKCRVCPSFNGIIAEQMLGLDSMGAIHSRLTIPTVTSQ